MSGELPRLMAVEIRKVGVPKMEIPEKFPIRLTEISFLDAPKHLERDALAHEFKREVAAHYPEVWGIPLQGHANWAQFYIYEPWENPGAPSTSPREMELKKRIDELRSRRDILDDWSGKGLNVLRAHHEVELVRDAELDLDRPESVFKAYAFNHHLWEGLLQDEAQFVFRIQLSAKRTDIKKSIDAWFSHFRKEFPPKPVGAPPRIEVSRFELAVVRLYRANLPLDKICAKLTPVFKDRAQKLSKGEVRKINLRVKRRIGEARKRFDIFRDGYPDDSWALPL